MATWFVYQDWIITLLGLLLGGLVVYMHPVSYTHLDVYKRQ